MLLRGRLIQHHPSFLAIAMFFAGMSACGDDIVQETETGSGSVAVSSDTMSSETFVPTEPTSESASATVTSNSTEATETTVTTVTTVTTEIETDTDTDPTEGMCQLDIRECDEPKHCCLGEVCPRDSFPFKWLCVEGICRHEDCSSDVQCDNLVTGFKCFQVGGVGSCVGPCGSNEDCIDLFSMGGTVCSGVSDDLENFCQGIPS